MIGIFKLVRQQYVHGLKMPILWYLLSFLQVSQRFLIENRILGPPRVHKWSTRHSPCGHKLQFSRFFTIKRPKKMWKRGLTQECDWNKILFRPVRKYALCFHNCSKFPYTELFPYTHPSCLFPFLAQIILIGCPVLYMSFRKHF